MPKLWPKLLLVGLSAGVFIFVIYNVDYPRSLTSATAFQLAAFLVPLYLSLTLAFDIIFDFFPISGSLSLGLIILLILKGLGSLNLVTLTINLVAVYLVVSYFWQLQNHSLTNHPKIPKLTNLSRRKR